MGLGQEPGASPVPGWALSWKHPRPPTVRGSDVDWLGGGSCQCPLGLDVLGGPCGGRERALAPGPWNEHTASDPCASVYLRCAETPFAHLPRWKTPGGPVQRCSAEEAPARPPGVGPREAPTPVRGSVPGRAQRRRMVTVTASWTSGRWPDFLSRGCLVLTDGASFTEAGQIAGCPLGAG